MRFFSSLLLVVVLSGVVGSADCAEKDFQTAIDSLKQAVRDNPDDTRARLNLGIAYYRAGNDFWAVRTLSRLVEANPAHCEARVWLGMAYLRRAFPENALDVVFNIPLDVNCDEPQRLRLAMVRALAENAMGRDPSATTSVAAGMEKGFADDVTAFSSVRRRVQPDRMPELSWMLEVTGGYTTNARMGSALDEAVSGDSAESALTGIDARITLVPDFGGPVRPLLELQPRLMWFFADSSKRFSYLELTGQAGLMIRSSLPRILIAYRPDWLLLPKGFRSDTEPVSFMMAHRGEFEIEITPELMVFGGAGKRIFREMPKSRVEADVGLGGAASPASGVNVLWAAGGRYYNANHPAWDVVGASVSAAFVMSLPHDLSARASTSLSIDWYPNSAATPEADPFNCDQSRLDFFMKNGLQLWAPALAGTRFGISYEFSYRDSRADLYSFVDHRMLLRFRYSGSTDMRRPRSIGRPGEIEPIDWGGDSGGMDERVRDMLRQDEQVQRSSSCLN